MNETTDFIVQHLSAKVEEELCVKVMTTERGKNLVFYSPQDGGFISEPQQKNIRWIIQKNLFSDNTNEKVSDLFRHQYEIQGKKCFSDIIDKVLDYLLANAKTIDTNDATEISERYEEYMAKLWEEAREMGIN